MLRGETGLESGGDGTMISHLFPSAISMVMAVSPFPLPL